MHKFGYISNWKYLSQSCHLKNNYEIIYNINIWLIFEKVFISRIVEIVENLFKKNKMFRVAMWLKYDFVLYLTKLIYKYLIDSWRGFHSKNRWNCFRELLELPRD